MPKAKSKMFNLLISDLYNKDTENEIFWDRVLHRLRGMQSVAQYPDGFPEPEAFIEELKPYFDNNGVYDIMRAETRMVTLQLGKSNAEHALINHNVAKNIYVMIPDYAWSLHVQPKVGTPK